MQRWLVIIIAVCVTTAVYFTIRYGLRPKAIPIINLTQFEDPEQIGLAIYKRLRQNVRADRVILLGSSQGMAEEDEKIWAGFIKAAQADKETIEELSLKDMPPDKEETIKQIKGLTAARKLVVVRGLTPEVSHLVDNSWSRILDKHFKHPVLSIATMRLGISLADADDLQTQCLDASDDDGHRKLDCAAQRVTRKNLKKKPAPDKIWAVMERHGLKEYLLFIHRP